MGPMDPASPVKHVLQSMPLWQLKALLCFASLVVAALGVLLPRALFYREQRQGMTYGLGLSIGNMLSAGGKFPFSPGHASPLDRYREEPSLSSVCSKPDAHRP